MGLFSKLFKRSNKEIPPVASQIKNDAKPLDTTSTANRLYVGTATGSYSYASGTQSYVWGQSSHAEGINVTAFGRWRSATEIMMSYLSEETIDKMFDEILEKLEDSDKDSFEMHVKEAVRSQHFSEEFLIKYLEYLDEKTILKNHYEDIKSGKYSTVALYLEVRD